MPIYRRTKTPAPSHAGSRKFLFDEARFAYNWKAENTRRLKAALGLGGYGGLTRGSFAVFGDSASEPQVGTGSWNQIFGWPQVLQDCLTAGSRHALNGGAGGAIYGGVNIFFGSSSINAFDGRVARTGTWTNNLGGYVTGANGATWTLPNPTFPMLSYTGTAIDVAYVRGGGAWNITVDGALNPTVVNGVATAGSNAPVVSGSGYAHHTLTGLTDQPHTVTVTMASATPTRFIGASIYRSNGFMVHNLSRSGSTAEEWAAATAGGLHEYRLNAQTPGAVSSVAFLKLGANDMALNGRTAAQIKTYLTTLKNLYPTLDWILMNYAEVGSPSSEWAAYNRMLYDLADEWDVPLIDQWARFGSFAQANAAGFMSADTNHPNSRYHVVLGAALAQLAAA